MRRSIPLLSVLFLTFSNGANAATISFLTNPFAGSDALTTPGRQVVGGEPSIVFDIGSDVFAFHPTLFGIDEILFDNDFASMLQPSDVNVVVLRDLGPPMAAGIAANLIAAQITEPGPGFFIYFNTFLGLPRLVYSTDLSEDTSDLKVLARLTNFSLEDPQVFLPTFTAANFDFAQVPEPTTLLLMTTGGALFASRRLRGKRTRK